MSESFEYSTTYILDKSHFSETYDETSTQVTSKNLYMKSIAMGVFGFIVLQFTDISAYFAWFLIALAGVEALSVRFQKPWWLARQMISKAANNRLTLTINEQGVNTKSLYVESTISWDSLNKLEKTNQGWLLFHTGGKAYLSDRCLSDEAQAFLQAKADM